MDKIFVCGHKNPDTDSICAALCLARFKNRIDSRNDHQAIRCGPLNKQTKYILKRLRVEAPPLEANLYPKVRDVMMRDQPWLEEEAPVLHAMDIMNQHKLRFLPIVAGEEYRGSLGYFEISDYLLKESRESYLNINIISKNLVKVLNGSVYHRGAKESFDAGLVVGGMSLESAYNWMQKAVPEKSILITGNRYSLIQQAINMNFSGIIITGLGDSRVLREEIIIGDYQGWVIATALHTAETIRKTMLSIPVKEIMKIDEQVLYEDTLVGDAQKNLNNKFGLPVVNDENKLLGIVTKIHLLDVEPKKVILVDHNETGQAIDGADEAEVVGIVDHHRLAPIRFSQPIDILTKPLGSSCTLVFELFEQAGLTIEKETAALLLSGIISDTIILRSPTTSEIDRQAAARLADIAGLNLEKYGQDIFKSGSILAEDNLMDALRSDFKPYNEGGVAFGISQIELIDLNLLGDREKELLTNLEIMREKEKLDWAMLIVSDIIKQTSVLLTSDYPPAEKNLAYRKISKNKFEMPGVLSRKKQLLPAIIETIEKL